MTGPPLLVCALFDAGTRRVVRNLIKGRIEVEGEMRTWDGGFKLGGGTLSATFDAGRALTYYQLAESLGALLDVARRLVPPPSLERAVADHVSTDPSPSLRLHHLQTLLAHGTDATVREDALVAALEDDSDAVRLEGALAFGERGRPVLLAIASDTSETDGRRARAVASLGAHLPADTTRGMLRGALDTDRDQTAAACIRSLALRDEVEAEPLFLRALQRAGEVRLGAVEALARVGSVSAVLALRQVEASQWHERTLVRTCRAAIASIQSRLPGAAKGQLGIAEAEDGQLSLADDTQGRIALDGTPPPPRP